MGAYASQPAFTGAETRSIINARETWPKTEVKAPERELQTLPMFMHDALMRQINAEMDYRVAVCAKAVREADPYDGVPVWARLWWVQQMIPFQNNEVDLSQSTF